MLIVSWWSCCVNETMTTSSTEIRGPALAGYQQFSFRHQYITHVVYHRSEQNNPPLLIMSELAGFAPGLLMFADRLVQQGYQVYLPWMFGPFGKRASLRNAMKLCISREFAYLRG